MMMIKENVDSDIVFPPNDEMILEEEEEKYEEEDPAEYSENLSEMYEEMYDYMDQNYEDEQPSTNLVELLGPPGTNNNMVINDEINVRAPGK